MEKECTHDAKHAFWRTLLNFMFRFCVPLTCAGVGLGCLFGYFIPEQLCQKVRIQASRHARKHVAFEDPSDQEERLGSCLFGGGGSFSQEVETRPWIVSLRSMVNFAWCLIPVLVIWTTHPNKIGRKVVFGGIGIGALSVLLTISWNYFIDKSFAQFGFVGLITFLVGVSAMLMSYFAFQSEEFHVARVPWGLMWPLIYFTIYLDMISLQNMMSTLSSLKELFLYRFILHEALWWMVEVMLRHGIRLSGTHSSLLEAIPLLIPKIYRGVFGWFGVLHLRHSFGFVHCVTTLFAFYQITCTTTSKSKDLWLIKILYGKKAAETMVASIEETQLEVADKVAEFLGQVASLGSIGGVLLVADVEPLILSPFRSPRLWISLLLGTLFLILEHFFRMVISRDFHQVEVRSLLSQIHWNRRWTCAFLCTLLIMLDANIHTISTLCMPPNNELVTCTKTTFFKY